MELYPAIDLKDGQCVRLLRGDFGTVHTVADDPAAVAVSYRDAGASIIHVVDLDGAKDGVRKNTGLVAEIVRAASPSHVELGGGLRCMEDLEAADALGVRRFVIGSAALEDPVFAKTALSRYGVRIAIGIDARGGMVRSRGWTEDSGRCELEFAREAASWGVQTIIYTDIETDGALAGPSVDRLAALREAVPDVCLVASGGVSSIDDIRLLRQMGIDAAIAGKALYAGNLSLDSALFEARFGHMFDKAQLVPAVTQDIDTGEVLILGYVSPESLKLTLQTRKMTFWSRSRECLWVKGETSGNFLDVISVSGNCEDNSLLVKCRPRGPACHTGHKTCFFKQLFPAKDEEGLPL